MRRARRSTSCSVPDQPPPGRIAALLLVTSVLPAGGPGAAAPALSPDPAPAAQAAGAGDPRMPEPAIRGAWRPTRYALSGGASHAVDGLIQFGEERWSVVFFVLDEEGRPRRASAEGGTYSVDGDRIVLTHRFNFSTGEEMEGLPASSLRMSIAGEGEGATEPTRWEVEDGELVLSFPSGNRMFFTRSSSGASRR